MKKLIFILTLVLILVSVNIASVFADAAAYDIQKAGYYVIVATPDGGLNLRHGPGVDYGKVMEGRIPDGVKLYISHTSSGWGLTTYNGYEGWVALSQTKTAPSYETIPAGYYVYVATPDGGLNLRQGPGTSYNKAMSDRIPDGVKLYISHTSGNWGLTTYSGYEGWVALSQTTTTPPAPAPVPAPETAKPTETMQPVETIIPEASSDVQTSSTVSASQPVMTNQIILIAILVLFVIIAALLVVIFINLKSKK